jgi:hypothetical protein
MARRRMTGQQSEPNYETVLADQLIGSSPSLETCLAHALIAPLDWPGEFWAGSPRLPKASTANGRTHRNVRRGVTNVKFVPCLSLATARGCA